jgi:tetratricopeptide (TPR) repeat protein
MALLGTSEVAASSERLNAASVLAEKIYGARSYEAARAQSGLCLAAEARSLFDEAADHCERSARIFGDVLGEHHPDYALAVSNLGTMFWKLGQKERSCDYHERALAIAQTALGPEHLRVLIIQGNVGSCVDEGGDHVRAVAILERTLALREKIEGKNGPRLAFPLTFLGKAYLNLGDVERAVKALARAVAVEDPAVEPGDRADRRFALARASWESPKDRRRAVGLAREARAIYGAMPAPLTRDVEAVDEWLARRATQ